MSNLKKMSLWPETVRLGDELRQWAVSYGYPVWSILGVDYKRGGFFEKIEHQGKPVALPRRGRVTPRQLYCFSMAFELGSSIDNHTILQTSVETYLERFFRPDGLIRTLVDADGAVLDDSVSLYDQAFGLFALASVTRTQPQILGLEARAKRLLEQLKARQANPLGGFSIRSASTSMRSLATSTAIFAIAASNSIMRLMPAWLIPSPTRRWTMRRDAISRSE